MLLHISGMGTVLIGLIVLVRKLVGDRLSPACYLMMWLMTGIRLLVPIEITSPFSIYCLLLPEITAPVQKFENILASDLIYREISLAQYTDSMIVSVDWMFLLWLIGAVLCFLWILIRHRRSRSLCGASLPVCNTWIKQWKKSHGLYRNYQIRQCQQIDAPLTYGVISPVILLPSHQKYTETELDIILLHEWHHIRHGDIFWQWMLAILCSIHWFNPAVWLMAILCRQDMELFCDEATVRHMQREKRRQYAFLLLRQAETLCTSIPFFSQAHLTGYHKMEERVKRIMNQKTSTRKTLLATAGLICITGLVFATSASGEVNSEKPWNVVDNLYPLVAEQAKNQMIWPVTAPDSKITLTYGVRVHPVTGEELEIDHICIGGVEKGADIVVAMSGEVKEAGFDVQKGYYLLVSHENNLETQYWHCDELLVEVGEYVTAGAKIATLGQTGDATGPCLSFAVYRDGVAYDPMQWMK